MRGASSRDVLAVTAAAVTGGVIAARWWARRSARELPAADPGEPRDERVDELRAVFGGTPAGRDGKAAEEVLRHYWRHLRPLRLPQPPAPAA